MTQVILFLGAISLLMDWYVFQGLKRLTSSWRSDNLRRAVYTIFWVFFVGFLIGFGIAVYVRFTSDRATPVVQWFINAFLTFFVTKLVFILVLFAEDIYRLAVAVARFFSKKAGAKGTPARLLPARRKFMSQVALALASVPFASFVYGTIKGKYNYQLHRHTLYFDDLPEAFDGFTITQISDVHSGSFDNADAVQHGIELVKAQQSDLFVFTGDLVNDHATEILPYMDAFSQIKAPYGQYSILGNHDYGMYADWPSEEAKEANLERLKQIQAAMGYRLLLDEHVAIEKDGQKLALIGVENWGTGFIQKGDLDKALQGVDQEIGRAHV